MANDLLLRDAVRAVKLKIQSAAASATPEELAYLGTAIDRIGGRATLLEVEELGDIKIREILEATADATADFTAARDAAQASINTTRDDLVAQASTTLVETANAINHIKEAAVATVVAQKEAAATSVTEAAQALTDAAAIATQQALNGSMFVNHFYASIR